MRTNAAGLVVPGHLNFHHLQYFWAVASDGNLTRAAERLRVSQSAVSAQIRQLEAQLGRPLFLREGRRLVLTEAGRLALDYARVIFGAGDELLATFAQGRALTATFRVGAVATLSRNFQESFLRPVWSRPDVTLRIGSGTLEDLLQRLAAHELDLVLSNRPVRRDPGHPWRCRRIARQPVSIIGPRRKRPFRFPQDLAGEAVLVPGPDSDIRAEFDALCERAGVKVSIRGEVDDMATLRLLVRDTGALAVLPSVVVRDELRAKVLAERCVVPGLFEHFYATSLERHFPHPLVEQLLARGEDELLEMRG